VPDGTDPGRSRCSKCRTRLRPAADDAYHLFASTAALALPPVPPTADPPAGPLSLDECEPIPTVGPPTVELPPPFKVPAAVLGKHPLRGPVTAVLTPFGVFVERKPEQPLAFAPVGTRATAAGRVLRLKPPAGPLALELPSARLAADAAGFLAGARPVPGPAEYRRPGWLLPAAVLAVFALLAVAFAAGAALYMTQRPAGVGEPPPPAPPGERPPGERPPDEGPSPPLPPTEPDHPPTHLDLAARDGMTRLPDGPAAVTALAVTPHGGETVVGYADGSTWAWRLDQPAFDPPRVGPRGVGPVRRIDFGPTAEVAYLTCDTGLAVAGFRTPRPAVLIPGHPVAAIPEPGRERFAAVRGDKLIVRNVPMGLVKEPPASRVKGGVVTPTPKEETQPANSRPELPAPGTTFLAWQPAGKLVYGSPDGTITAFPTGVKAVPLGRIHKAPVRAWAAGPVWPDFATGDENGVVGVWPDKAAPYTLRAGAVAVTQLSFSWCGGEVAVADAAGAVSVWNLPTRSKVFELVRPTPVVLAYGPRADTLLLADGKGVEVWSLPELAARAGATWP
jgi:hypothetical protein